MASSSALRSGIKNYARYLNVLSGTTPYVAPPQGPYEWLETTTLSSEPTDITFSNLLSTYGTSYQHLQVRGVAKNNTGLVYGSLGLRFNGISTNSYRRHNLSGDGSSPESGSSALTTSLTSFLQLAGSGAASSIYSSFIVDILDPFNTNKNTTVRAYSGRIINSGGGTDIRYSSGLFVSTAAITSITFLGEAGNITSSSRFSLYGLKAS